MSEIFDPPSASAIVVGNTVYVVLGSMIMLALFGPAMLRALATVAGLTRGLSQGVARLWSRPGRFGGAAGFAGLDRPLHIEGLSPRLANLAQQTRTLALELRRCSEAARHWPEDAAELEGVEVEASSWWRALVSESIDFRPLMDTRRDVFEWLDSAARLSPDDREALERLGIEVEAVRAALVARGPIAECMRSLAGLLWSIDERFAGATTSGYRSNAAEAGGSLMFGCGGDPTSDEDDHHRANRRRFHDLLGAHRRGLSRMAGSYARSSSEREDLEQDIALALWSSLPKFRGESKLETFAYRVARYCCYAHARRRGRVEVDGEAVHTLHDPLDIEQQLLDADKRAQVEQAVGELPETLGDALRLHLDGMSYAEIAAQLGISEQNVSVRLTRARRRLEHQLAAA